MSSLTYADKRYLEKILDMEGGYVLDFSDATFEEFFKPHGIDIHSYQYQTYGTSKAKKMRAFWEKESDSLVGQVLSEMLDIYEMICNPGTLECNHTSLAKCREIVVSLLSKPMNVNSNIYDGFLSREFEIPDIQKLPVDLVVSEIIQDRLEEAQSCLSHGAYLAVIFLCGSVLEAVLLGAAQKNPERFNRSPVSPKRNGKVKAFHEWNLSEFINVAHGIGLLSPDVQTFSHGLRNFRNYIHPYQQMASGFKPDEHTAKVCFQVLNAALADVLGER